MNADVRAAIAVVRHGLDLLERELDLAVAKPAPAPEPQPAAEPPADLHLAPYLHGGEVIHLPFDQHRLLGALEELADTDGIYRGGRRGLEQKARMGHELISDTLAALAQPSGDRKALVRRVAGPRGRQDFAVLTLARQ